MMRVVHGKLGKKADSYENELCYVADEGSGAQFRLMDRLWEVLSKYSKWNLVGRVIVMRTQRPPGVRGDARQ